MKQFVFSCIFLVFLVQLLPAQYVIIDPESFTELTSPTPNQIQFILKKDGLWRRMTASTFIDLLEDSLDLGTTIDTTNLTVDTLSFPDVTFDGSQWQITPVDDDDSALLFYYGSTAVFGVYETGQIYFPISLPTAISPTNVLVKSSGSLIAEYPISSLGGGASLDSASVSFTILDDNEPVTGSGVLNGEGYWRCPSWFNGYQLAGVSYNMGTAPSGTTNVQLNIDTGSGSSNSYAATFTTGETYENILGLGSTLSTGNVLRLQFPVTPSGTPGNGMRIDILLVR